MIDRHRRRVVVDHTVAAPPAAVFAVLADPSHHAAIDGSGALLTAGGADAGPLALGSVFVTPMRRRPTALRRPDLLAALVATLTGGRMRNTVVEYEQDRRIAWRNVGHHVWRYELAPGPTPSTTVVTETFDWSTNLFPPLLELADFPAANHAAMQQTLRRLAALVSEPDRGR